MAYTKTTQQVITDTYLLATGKATGLDITSTKGVKILALLNYFVQEWANEKGVNWRSLRNTFTLGATVTATNTFTLPTTIGRFSRQEGDFVRIYHTDGVNESDYTIVPIERLYENGPTLNNVGNEYCAISGTSLIFTRPFVATDPQFGGTIKVPGYSIPATLDSNDDVPAVDNPDWLSARTAAEYVRNDVTRVQLYNSLLDIAADKMSAMKMENDTQIEEVYRPWAPLGETW